METITFPDISHMVVTENKCTQSKILEYDKVKTLELFKRDWKLPGEIIKDAHVV